MVLIMSFPFFKTSSMSTGKDDKKKFHYSISPLIFLHLGEIIHERKKKKKLCYMFHHVIVRLVGKCNK